VDKLVNNMYGLFVFISWSIEYKNWQVMLQLFRTLFRPQFEYCVQFWSPHYQKDVETLERAQKRFTRMLPGLDGLGSEESLGKLGLFSLERRRLRGDLIEVTKLSVNDSRSLFPRVEMSITRGHWFKVKGGKFKGDVRGNCFYTKRVK